MTKWLHQKKKVKYYRKHGENMSKSGSKNAKKVSAKAL